MEALVEAMGFEKLTRAYVSILCGQLFLMGSFSFYANASGGR